jgi:hypothetical protein
MPGSEGDRVDFVRASCPLAGLSHVNKTTYALSATMRPRAHKDPSRRHPNRVLLTSMSNLSGLRHRCGTQAIVLT